MHLMTVLASRWQQYSFLFEELVKRDFKKRYKRTYLGIVWSLLGPLLQLAVMSLVFVNFFGQTIQHFMIYVFCGLLVFSFFKESTNMGMQSLMMNKDIFTKLKVPKYLFLLSRNISSLINFALTLVIFFMLAAIDGVAFSPRFLLLLYPVVTLVVFNIGVGLVLSALYVFFKDIQYLYDIFTMLLMWLSAVFYTVDGFSITVQRLFLLNPIYAHIHYFRLVVLFGAVPAWHVHLICAGYALFFILLGAVLYKKFNYRFIYYM